MKASVEKIVQAKSPNDVQVDIYPDVEWGDRGPAWQSAPAGMAASQGGSTLEWITLFSNYGSQAGLVMLAMIGLVMMLRVVKRSTELATTAVTMKAIEIPSADEPMLAVESAPVGQAAPSNAFLVGREVDDESLRSSELTSEVAKMVQEDPKGAAELLRRWLNDN